MVVKKSLIIFSIAILLISMSFVFAEITGEITRSVGTGAGLPTSVSSDTSTTGTRTETTTFADRISLRKGSATFGATPLGWTQVDALGGGKCYIQKPLSRSLFTRG